MRKLILAFLISLALSTAAGAQSIWLQVIVPVGGYTRGQIISDPSTISSVLATYGGGYFNAIVAGSTPPPLPSTNGLQLGNWATSTRPAGVPNGTLGLNSTLGQIDAMLGGTWTQLVPATGSNLSVNLGTGALTAQGGVFGTLSATGAVSLTGSGTALSVSNNGVFGAGGTAPITIQSGEINASANPFTLYLGSGNRNFFSSPNGYMFSFSDPGAPITGFLTLAPGSSNNPITFLTNNSSNPNQGFAFETAHGVGSQIIFTEPGFAGAYAAPGANPYNCGGAAGYVLICSNTDTLSGGAPPSLQVIHQFGGVGTTGGRIAANFSNILISSAANTSATFYQAGNFNAEMRANAGGTSTSALGNNFGYASYARLENGATYFVENASVEHDISIETGASALNLHGVSVILLSVNSVAPSREGIAFAAGMQPGGVATLTCAFCVGRIDSDNPVAPSGTLFGFVLATGESAQTVANGVDIHDVSFTGNAWNDGHVSFTGNGDALMNSASALATTATTGFLHLPNMAGAPTGTPGTISGDACVINTATFTLNCYIGSGWYHTTLTAGAG